MPSGAPAACSGRRADALLRQVDDLDPLRVLADRILLQLRELAVVGVDRIAAYAVRHLADREQKAAPRIDGEAARLLLGLVVADRRQLARRIDGEGGDGVRR